MTNDEKKILAHIVVDPDAWYNHAVSWFGQELADQHLAVKVAKYKDQYDGEKVKPGYKNRLERDQEEELKRKK